MYLSVPTYECHVRVYQPMSAMYECTYEFTYECAYHRVPTTHLPIAPPRYVIISPEASFEVFARSVRMY